jgi:hypothetical protein
MPAAKYNLEIEQGATFTLALVYKDSEDAVIDLSGYSGRMQIRAKASSATAVIDATTANGLVSIDGTAGSVTVTVSATATSAMAITAGVYDLEIESTSAVVTRLLQGKVTVSPGVTR